jgi:hypothetical protein
MSSRKGPNPETLHKEQRYRLILQLDFNEMIPFVITNIRKASLSSFLYLIINSASLMFIIIYILWSINLGHINTGRVIWLVLAGILAGSFLVIPPHELLHGLAYRILGARKIKFGADLQQFIFYVTADGFPISKKELAFLAMTPFVLINLLLIVFTVIWAPQLTLFSASFLLCHNMMCIGDFAMISYAYSHKNEIFTYDDTENKKSYFFERQA